ncbi:MAG TPA: sodium:solute symporter family protein [Burkholderiales bacterium]|nr:sodium:solute symporter family protein [Burkholderiales bacterium]
MAPVIILNAVDYAIIAGYILVMILVGYSLKKYMKTGEDFFLSGRSLPGWITGLAFLSANLGALEVIGMVANSAKYGIATVHFYWVGAIPAMVFLGIFMMPFYYGSRVRTVPEYLKLRYNEATRGLNAISFAIMTVLMSGVSLYAMALLFKIMLGWSLTWSIVFAAVVVFLYILWGGLSSSIYNEVIQFFLIWLGLLPIVFLGLRQVGGFAGFAAKLREPLLHSVKYLGTSNNPLGVDWFGVVFGLGFVLSFGYWTTDFLVVQRALASKNINSARMTPIIASFPKMLVPVIVVIPGLVALLVLPEFSQSAVPSTEYNSALILLMKHYLPNGVLGLAITGLLASFMSGMAGNVTAFNTIWTYDIYGSYIRRGKPDSHYLRMGKYATFFGIAVSVGTASIVRSFPNLMDYMQLIFSFFNAPLFATFLLGMFWAGATAWGGFFGLLVGIATAAGHYILYKAGVLHYASAMAGNFYQAWWAWLVDFVVTIGVSLFTRKRNREELKGLVFGLTPRAQAAARWFARPAVWGSLAIALAILLNILFW